MDAPPRPPAVDHRRFDLGDKYRPDGGPTLITGVQAIVRLLIEQRMRDAAAGSRTGIFVSGYEGSPLASLDTTLTGLRELLAQHDVRFVPGQNEELAATAVWGTQQPIVAPGGKPAWDGVVGLWYGKAPGLDRVGDVLRHANILGTHPRGGILAMSGDDPGCKSSTIPSASDRVFAGLTMPVLYPRNAAELVRLGLLGIELSRFSGCCVGLKIVADVADGLWSVDTFTHGPEAFIRPEIFWNGAPWSYTQGKLALAPHSVLAEADLMGPRWLAVERFIEANGVNAIEGAQSDAWIGIVAAGKTYGDVREALHELGLHDHDLEVRGIRLLNLGATFPIERNTVERFAQGLDEIFVVEEKRSFIEAQIRDILYSAPHRPLVTGKADEKGAQLVPADGELAVGRIMPALRARLERRIDLPPAPNSPSAEENLATTRMVYFCSGCPHNRSTVLPEGSLGSAGIGCHGMTALIPRSTSAVTGITQMGGEGAQWIGQAAYAGVDHIFQNIGDGTYFHSGQLAVQACIAAGVNITYKILYNGAVAMTGGQDVVATIDVPSLAQKLTSEGVREIIVCAEDPKHYPKSTVWPKGTSVWHRDRLDEAQRKLRDVPGVTVLIYDQRCAAESRRLRKRGKLPDPRTRVFINERACEGCGDCGVKSNCLSVVPTETEFGRKRRIDQSSCNKDYSCLDGDCPSFVTVEVDRKAIAPGRGEPPVVAEPSRPTISGEDTYDLLFVGIGGTGVVTVNHVLATAAMGDGLFVTGVDQTGLSQKAGPVTSHLRLATSRGIGAGRVSPLQTNAYLVFDVLGGADAKLLALCDPKRTRVTVSTSAPPTGPMIADRRVRMPNVPELRSRIERHALPGVWLDATAAAECVVGDAVGANLLLIGAAYQAGQIPISAESIEWALRLNGVAVEMNVAAFRWGRVAVADPKALERVMKEYRTGQASPEPEAEPRHVADLFRESTLAGETLRVARLRAADLVAYQGIELARRYLKLVKQIWRAERASGITDTRLSETVARQFYRLLAYKDEYEVARLHTSKAFARDLATTLPGARRLRYRLHPPILRALGFKHKIALGSWFSPVLHVLRGLRFVRGTPFDPFGSARVRRVERALGADFEAYFRDAGGNVADRYANLVATAEAAELVCGYEEIKLAGVREYLSRLQTLGASAPRTEELLGAR